jgi:hypothetical protein
MRGATAIRLLCALAAASPRLGLRGERFLKPGTSVEELRADNRAPGLTREWVS